MCTLIWICAYYNTPRTMSWYFTSIFQWMLMTKQILKRPTNSSFDWPSGPSNHPSLKCTLQVPLVLGRWWIMTLCQNSPILLLVRDEHAWLSPQNVWSSWWRMKYVQRLGRSVYSDTWWEWDGMSGSLPWTNLPSLHPRQLQLPNSLWGDRDDYLLVNN